MSFNLNLNITSKERSKDSHSIIKIWQIKENELSYNEQYTGRLKSKIPKIIKKRISQEEINSIKQFLKENGLYKNIPSPKYNDFHAPYSAIHVNLKININQTENYLIDIYELNSHINKNLEYKKIKILERYFNSLIQ